MSAPDPVKGKSAYISMYMSQHRAALAAYVMHELYLHDKPYHDVTDVHMDSIDSHSIKLSYRPAKKMPKTDIIIPFDPPLLGYEEVRPRLVAMKQDAEEHLGMVKYPKIDTFAVPDAFWLAIIAPLLGLLVYVSLPGSTHYFADWVRHQSFGWKGVGVAWIVVFVLHGLETYYASILCKRHAIGESNTTLWLVSTAIWGIASLSSLKHTIAEARIRSAKKQK